MSHKISGDSSYPKKMFCLPLCDSGHKLLAIRHLDVFFFSRNSDQINRIERPKSTWRDIKRKNPICFSTRPTVTNGYIVFPSSRTAWIKKITIVFFPYPPNLSRLLRHSCLYLHRHVPTSFSAARFVGTPVQDPDLCASTTRSRKIGHVTERRRTGITGDLFSRDNNTRFSSRFRPGLRPHYHHCRVCAFQLDEHNAAHARN